MKRIILLLLVSLTLFVIQGLLNCSSPLETDEGGLIPNPPIIIDSTDTIYITDTIFSNDTIIVTDTLFVPDSTTTVDTIIVVDTNIIIDTIVNNDTLIITDTVTIYDSSTVFDTVTVIDTIINWDTIVVNDTITNIDTIVIYDTIPGDTIFDTIPGDTIYDTTVVYDTTIINVPDSTDGIPLCARLDSHRPEIVWILKADPGEYSFEFLAVTDDFSKCRELIVTINDAEYRWNPAQLDEMRLDITVDSKITIRIVPDKPAALGHPVDICLTVNKK